MSILGYKHFDWDMQWQPKPALWKENMNVYKNYAVMKLWGFYRIFSINLSQLVPLKFIPVRRK